MRSEVNVHCLFNFSYKVLKNLTLTQYISYGCRPHLSIFTYLRSKSQRKEYKLEENNHLVCILLLFLYFSASRCLFQIRSWLCKYKFSLHKKFRFLCLLCSVLLVLQCFKCLWKFKSYHNICLSIWAINKLLLWIVKE